ncbi:hypothetical protein [Streptomyces massasporeus]|jgi:hypothetical protein
MTAELGPLAITRRNSSEPLRAGGETVGRLGDFWSSVAGRRHYW